LYSQEHVGKGEYQLLNTLTDQFVQASANRVRTICSRGGRTGCIQYLLIDVTDYSGNTQITVSQRQYALTGPSGLRYAPASARRAAPVVPGGSLLPTTVLQPDDDGDYASGTLVFLVPKGPGRYRLSWQGLHVATLVITAHGTLYEMR
jgi:hypothetical protein